MASPIYRPAPEPSWPNRHGSANLLDGIYNRWVEKGAAETEKKAGSIDDVSPDLWRAMLVDPEAIAILQTKTFRMNGALPGRLPS